MKIVIVNGSPKISKGATNAIINTVRETIGDLHQVFQAMQICRNSEEEKYKLIIAIKSCDALLIAFPLYADALPTPLLKTLQYIESQLQKPKNPPKVFAISQCGFYEASHNKIALDMIQHFCRRTELKWQYGLGIGTGELLPRSKNIKKALTKRIYNAIHTLSHDIMNENCEKCENIYVTTSMPRCIYKFGGHISWKMMAKKNNAADTLKTMPFKIKQ